MALLRLVSVVLAGYCLCVAGCGDGSPSTGGTGGTGGTMFEAGPTCTPFCAKVVGECEAFSFTEASCRQGCEQNLAEERSVSEACGEAVEAWFQCATDLDCAGVAAWRDASPGDDTAPCFAEAANGDVVCLRI